MQKKIISLLGLLTIFALVVSSCNSLSSEDVISLSNQIESNAFSLSYPDDWQHQIPQTNMLFLASPEVLAQEAGATITLQRSVALSSSADTLSAALDSYLERGPLRSDRNWELDGAIETIELDGYETVRAIVEGSEDLGTLAMRSEIYVLQAESSFYFILTLTAPINQWDTVSPIFVAIKNSIDIRE